MKLVVEGATLQHLGANLDLGPLAAADDDRTGELDVGDLE